MVRGGVGSVVGSWEFGVGSSEWGVLVYSLLSVIFYHSSFVFHLLSPFKNPLLPINKSHYKLVVIVSAGAVTSSFHKSP